MENTIFYNEKYYFLSEFLFKKLGNKLNQRILLISFKHNVKAKIFDVVSV